MSVYKRILASLGAAVPQDDTAEAIYFVGIGGIGMSALARYFHQKGVRVSGYDKTPTTLTAQLIKEGIAIHYEDNVSFIDPAVQLVVYTPAIPKDHQELNYYKQAGYMVVKRSDVLGAITQTSFNICIAGTHGKTTTSTMIAHILHHSQYGCNAFLGGIAANYDSNYLSSDNNVCVIEADEYDRSFLKLSPDIAIITAMDADHLDIYGTQKDVQDAFIDFSGKIKEGGLLISKYNLPRQEELKASQHFTYHLNNSNAHAYAKNINISEGSYTFDIVINNWELKNVVLNMGGLHNIENMVAAITVAHHLKIDANKILLAVKDFKGVKRRFEYIIKPGAEKSNASDIVFVDDYAHHPEELKALIMGAKKLFPDKKCTIVFQPHLFSRTNDFADGFAEALDMADNVILLPVYPARELPMEGVTSELISGKMKNKNVVVVSKDQLVDVLKQRKIDLLITAGAGDIDTLVEPIRNWLHDELIKIN